MERTYLDILNELYGMIETDNIPQKDKDRIMKTIDRLKDILWVYSA